MPNIEIKARFEDHDKAREIALSLGGVFVGIDRQTDTYFRSPKGRLKLRESSLNGAQLVPYVRPDQSGPKKSDYIVVPVTDPKLCKHLLSEILGVDVVVDKVREIYTIGNVRVHIDKVTGLGNFFEFEAVYDDPALEKSENEKVRKLLDEFGIQEKDLLRGSYREMMRKFTPELSQPPAF